MRIFLRWLFVFVHKFQVVVFCVPFAMAFVFVRIITSGNYRFAHTFLRRFLCLCTRFTCWFFLCAPFTVAFVFVQAFQVLVGCVPTFYDYFLCSHFRLLSFPVLCTHFRWWSSLCTPFTVFLFVRAIQVMVVFVLAFCDEF